MRSCKRLIWEMKRVMENSGTDLLTPLVVLPCKKAWSNTILTGTALRLGGVDPNLFNYSGVILRGRFGCFSFFISNFGLGAEGRLAVY